MRIVLDAESCMKTATVYALCEEHGEADAYLNPANYCAMSAFFDYQDQRVKTRIGIASAKALGVRSVKMKQFAFAYHTLPDFRNICAHDERPYCARFGKNRDLGFDQMLRALKAVTTGERLSEYAKTLDALLDDLVAAQPVLEQEELSGMSVSRSDISALMLS